jgi:hypothetical protein
MFALCPGSSNVSQPVTRGPEGGGEPTPPRVPNPWTTADLGTSQTMSGVFIRKVLPSCNGAWKDGGEGQYAARVAGYNP